MKKMKIVVLILLIVGACFVVWFLRTNTPPVTIEKSTETDYRNISYTLDNQTYKLTTGVAEVQIVPDSASQVVVRYFGNEVKTDLNKDGLEDVVFLLTQESGGSGTFFYVVAALKTENGYIGSKGTYLGDRISPQTIEVQDGNIVVNYIDRAPSDSFAMQPSLEVRMYLHFDVTAMEFTEVVNNDEPSSVPEEGVEGVWQSDDDPLAHLVFSEDGTMKNIYNDTEINSGTWYISPPENSTDFFDILHTAIDDTKFDYSVVQVTSNVLKISFLQRGIIISYTRIP